MPFVNSPFRNIPSRLYHYTNPDAAFCIISDGKRKGQEICFLLKNVKDKNDEAELKLGIELLERVLAHLKEKRTPSLLFQMGQFDKAYVNSFSENGSLDHMVSMYGNVRLEFDFRDLKMDSPVRECDYVREEDVVELATQYSRDIDVYRERLQNPCKETNDIFGFINAEMGIVMSLPLLKLVDEWSEEKEWRQVFFEQNPDSRIVSGRDGLPRMIVYYPANALKRITYFVNKDKKNKILPYYYKMKHFVCKKGWGVDVKIVFLDSANLSCS